MMMRGKNPSTKQLAEISNGKGFILHNAETETEKGSCFISHPNDRAYKNTA